MKMNGIPDDENLGPKELAALMGAMGPRFRPTQKVWLKVGADDAGMIVAVVCYVSRYAYRVRWNDGTLDEYDDYELTDTKTWG